MPVATRRSAVWRLMSELVLDHQRRREVSDAVVDFSRARAVRRVARKSMSMGDLADVLGIDRPNASVVINDLEAQRFGSPHGGTRLTGARSSSRRRGKERGSRKRANEILGTPPAGPERARHRRPQRPTPRAHAYSAAGRPLDRLTRRD